VSRRQAYALLKRYANTSDAAGLKKPRAILLLWFLKNVYGLDDLDAYEFVCDGDADQGIDGLYLEPPEVGENVHTLILFQSKYPVKPSEVGPNDLKSFVGSALPFQTSQGLAELMKNKLEPELLALVRRYEVEKLLRQDNLEIRLVFVTAGHLNDQARRQMKATNRRHGEDFLTVYDIDLLGGVCEALERVRPVEKTVKVSTSRPLRFLTQAGGNRVAICSVKSSEVVTWPGIEDRSLFDLNVRRELRRNRVRRELDRAISRAADHKNFIAFHNGLTVVCEKLDPKPSSLTITNFSVVNGAQSVIAFFANRARLTDDLRILVKFVEVGPQNPIAREVARRSNMQNPVNARNLRALDGRQLIIAEQFDNEYPRIYYETRPDTKAPPGYAATIKNDDAAQLICAIYTQKPWLAVKRLALFEDAYIEIFRPSIGAHQIVLADRIRQRVEANKSRFPEDYRRAWSLTALVAVYLVGQLMRTDDDLEEMLYDPEEALQDGELNATLDQLVRHVIGTLRQRAENKRTAEAFDDFKVDFKNETVLTDLRKRAREQYVYTVGLEDA
jgi:AIPR protein